MQEKNTIKGLKEHSAVHDVLAEIIQRCKEKRLRFTEPRQAVMEVLLSSKKPLKAYDIIDMLEGRKPMSIYRALDFLCAQGFAHRIESLNAYKACHEIHCDHNDSFYIVCDQCGAIEELHNHALQETMMLSSQKLGFKPSSVTAEIHGLCKSCT